MNARDVSLFDVDDIESTTLRVRDTVVHPVTNRDVMEFCRRYHYTQKGENMPWRYGLWHGVTLLGVVAYNLPTRDACESVFGPERHEHVWHMGRLALADVAPHNSESRLIAGSLQRIHKDYPDVWGVLTYAATDAGHIGYVYQATNALYTGTGGHATYYTDAGGGRHSDYSRGRQVTTARAAEKGWTRQAGSAKHRYVYILGNRTQRRHRRAALRLPVLPYPKAEIELRPGA